LGCEPPGEDGFRGEPGFCSGSMRFCAQRSYGAKCYVAQSMVRSGGRWGKEVESGEFVRLTCTKVQVG
jgi:hypothetical protein